jgi:hypothetical protein
METKQLKIPTNGSAVVEFMFDQPKTGTNDYGQWNLYGLKKDGEDVSLFATDLLHSKLQYYKTGDVVEIAKNETEQGRIALLQYKLHQVVKRLTIELLTFISKYV